MEKNLFSGVGRIRRSTYLARMIVATAINSLVQFMAKADPLTEILCLIIIVIVAIFSIIQGIKRMQDVGKSGWYILIPIYNLILAFTDSTPGKNKFGKNPKKINPQEDELYNGFKTLLFAAFVSCAINAFLTITNIINEETFKNIIFIVSFTTCSLYLLTWYINKTEQKNLKGNDSQVKTNE